MINNIEIDLNIQFYLDFPNWYKCTPSISEQKKHIMKLNGNLLFVQEKLNECNNKLSCVFFRIMKKQNIPLDKSKADLTASMLGGLPW